jgi:hypothetical protein
MKKMNPKEAAAKKNKDTSARNESPNIISTRFHCQFSADDSGLLKEGKRSVIKRIIDIVYDLTNTSVDDHLCAHQTGGKSRIECCILDTHSMISSLSNCVLFAMRAETLF